MRSTAALLVVFLIPSVAAEAQGVQPFDVAGGGSNSACILVLTFPSPALEFHDISTDHNTDIEFIGPGGSGRVLGLVNPRGEIVEIRPDLTRTPVFSGIDGAFGSGFVVDAAGNIYLDANAGRLFAIRPDGTIRAEYALEMWSMDLAADQCTLFYSTIGGIRRFDVCTGTALPDFLPGSSPGAIDFKLLPDGGLLDVEGNAIIRYDAAGTQTRTYPLPDHGAAVVALGRAGRTMFAGGNCNEGVIREYDLDTGALLRTFSFDFPLVTDIVAYNGFTAALGPTAAAHVAAVPSLSTAMLSVLGALLALIAFRRL